MYRNVSLRAILRTLLRSGISAVGNSSPGSKACEQQMFTTIPCSDDNLDSWYNNSVMFQNASQWQEVFRNARCWRRHSTFCAQTMHRRKIKALGIT